MRRLCAVLLALPLSLSQRVMAEDAKPEAKLDVKVEKDDAVNVTSFNLKDGTKIQGTSWSSLGDKDLKSYLINTLEGRRMIVLEKELQGRTEELIADFSEAKFAAWSNGLRKDLLDLHNATTVIALGGKKAALRFSRESRDAWGTRKRRWRTRCSGSTASCWGSFPGPPR